MNILHTEIKERLKAIATSLSSTGQANWTGLTGEISHLLLCIDIQSANPDGLSQTEGHR